MDATQPRGMAESHSQDLHASSDEECSRTVAVETSGLKMGGTRSQDLLLGGCEGLRRRKRKKRKQQKQEVAVSKATVSKATVSGMTNNVPNQPGSSVKLAAEEDILEDSQQLSPSAATSFDRPHEKQVLPEGLGAEATESNLDSKEPSKRPKSALDGSKKHRKTSFKKTRLRDRLSSRELDTEESSSDAAQTAKRAQYEKSMTGEVDTLKLTPICQKSNNEATASKDLLTSTQFSKSILRRRLRNARNSRKLQTSVFTYQTPALDKASWLQAVRDVDMETGVLSQRRVIHGSRARRQLQVKVHVSNSISPSAHTLLIMFLAASKF